MPFFLKTSAKAILVVFFIPHVFAREVYLEDIQVEQLARDWIDQYQKERHTEDDLQKFFQKIIKQEIILDIDTAKYVVAQLTHYFKKNQRRHQLHGYFVDKLSTIRDENISKNLDEIRGFDGSCPEKQDLKLFFETQKNFDPNKETVRRNLEKLSLLKDHLFQEEVLNNILAVSDTKSEEIKKILWNLVKDNADLIAKYPWVVPIQNKEILSSAKIMAAFLKKDTKKGRCIHARRDLEVFLNNDKKTSLTEALPLLEQVESCFLRVSKKDSVHFWQGIKPLLVHKYGQSGVKEVNFKLAYLYWRLHDLEKAKPYLESFFSEQDIDIGKKYFFQGKIYDELSAYPQAIRSFQKAISSSGWGHWHELALRELVLQYIRTEDWKHITDVLQSYVDYAKETEGYLSFFMFWYARALLHTEPKAARKYFERLAREYSSSYYGVLSHFLIEKISGQKFVVEKDSSFIKKSLFNELSEEDRVVLDRIISLKQLKLNKKVECELREFRTENDPNKIFTKFLLLYVNNLQFEALQEFNKLPKDFRHNVPYGIERALYPRNYQPLIFDYTQRLGIDSDLVNALVRQESVFNPQAKSVAGARGLMQLMGWTARSEVRKMKNTYVTKTEKNYLERVVKNPVNLHNVETNIIIGSHYLKSLLEKYGGKVSYTLSSYNAGPTITDKWIKRFGSDDQLYFIEKIPYKETNIYVKIIMRNYFYYKRWYKKDTRSMAYFDQVLDPVIKTAQKSMALAEKEKTDKT